MRLSSLCPKHSVPKIVTETRAHSHDYSTKQTQLNANYVRKHPIPQDRSKVAFENEGLHKMRKSLDHYALRPFPITVPT